MKVNTITEIADTFTYKTYHWLNNQKYILAVRDSQKDRQVIAIILVDNSKLIDLDETEFNKFVWTTTNSQKEDKPLSRFFENQLIAINYGSLTTNNNEKDWQPKVKTFNENINDLERNTVIEIIEGKIVEDKALFKPQLREIYKLIKDFYIEQEQIFFILQNQKILGPFKAINVFDDESFTIVKSNSEINFGEYTFDEKSYLEFEANQITRRVFVKNCSNLTLIFKKEYDFKSDDELLKDFENELVKHPNYFNENELKNVISILKKASEVDRIESKIKQNNRLEAILRKGEKIIDRDIDLLNNIPEIRELKNKKQELEEGRQELEEKVRELEEKRTRLSIEIKELEDTKKEELEVRRNDLNKAIEDLETQKINLEEEVEQKRQNLESNLLKTKEDIEYYERNKTELKTQIEILKKEFKEGQENAQISLQNLIKSKVHFDFISGRDLSEQENTPIYNKDYRVENKYASDQYREFRNDLVNILKQNNRHFEPHFIDNLLISVFQNTLTVLAGVPGTGKTTLARLFANILAPEEKIREVSVNRGWTSQKDFIGFVNPLTKRFHSSSTDIYSLLKQMNEEAKDENVYQNTPVSFVILDEANLSPLEHYWSSFYSLTDSKGMLEIKLGHNETIKFPNNLRFIGTINYDHTTEELSPRVLDRINIIRLNDESKDKDYNFSTIPDSKVKTIQLTFQRCIDFFDTVDLQLEDKDDISFKSIKNEFKKLKIHISPRVEGAIRRYIKLASKYMLVINKPLDYCIAQRLLPLINLQGSENKQKLESLNNQLKELKCDISVKILEDIINIGSEKGLYENNFNYFLTLSNV